MISVKHRAFIDAFNQSVESARVFLSITRASELQTAECEKLNNLLKKVFEEKKTAIEDANEDYANMLLGCECVLNTLISEIQMWLLLKEEKPDEAWDQLISAQMASAGAVRASKSFSELEKHSLRLKEIETLVFPKQQFISSGLIVHRQECSICSQEYDN